LGKALGEIELREREVGEGRVPLEECDVVVVSEEEGEGDHYDYYSDLHTAFQDRQEQLFKDRQSRLLLKNLAKKQQLET